MSWRIIESHHYSRLEEKWKIHACIITGVGPLRQMSKQKAQHPALFSYPIY